MDNFDAERGGGEPQRESVRESLEWVARGEHDPGSVPSEPSEAKPESVRDALERTQTELETSAREQGELDEVFGPLASRMTEQKLSRVAVTKLALGVAEQLHRNPTAVFSELAAHLRSQGTDLDALLHQAATAAPGADPQTERLDSTIRSFAETRADFEAVRERMGELMMSAVQRGETMSMEQAYQARRQGRQASRNPEANARSLRGQDGARTSRDHRGRDEGLGRGRSDRHRPGWAPEMLVRR